MSTPEPQLVYNSQLDAFDLYHLHQRRKRDGSFLGGPALPALGHAVAGSTGAAISNVITYPLDLVITRLQIQRHVRKNAADASEDEYKSLGDALQKTYRDEGWRGLYTGVLHDTAKTVADSFLFFLAYTFVRQARLRRLRGGANHLSVIEELSVGFVAGAFAKLVTTPLANVVTRLQTASMVAGRNDGPERGQNATFVAIARQIQEEKGWQGFWSGYSASLVLTLNPSLTFFFFETFKRLALPSAKRGSPPPAVTFLFAAFSKALASSATYPFSLAKARAQVSSKRTEPEEEVKDGIEKATGGQTSGTGRGRKAARTTIFGTIIQIARTDGLSGLYEGLGGEVIKGFFSHGTTMIVKDVVHRFIIALYYLVLKLLKRFPAPEELAKQAKGGVQRTIERAKNSASSSE